MPYKDPLKQKEKNRRYHLLHREEINERRKRNYLKRHDIELKQSRDYYHSPKGFMKYRKDQVAQYGITLEEYNRLFLLQKGLCAICGILQEKSLDVDHCHKTNRVRGLLCRKCNLGIGFMQDNPDICKKASEYLS